MSDDEQKRLWFIARDTLFSDNQKKHQGFQEALRLAKLSTHVEAQWLVNICERNGGMPKTSGEVVEMFMSHRDDPKAMFYGLFLRHRYIMIPQDSLKIAADSGDGYAQAIIFSEMVLTRGYFDETSVNYLKQSAEQEDHFGLYLYGIYLAYCEGNALEWSFLDFWREHFHAHVPLVGNYLKRAIDLGNVGAMLWYARSFTLDQPERFHWLIEYAVAKKYPRDCFPFKRQIDNYQTKGGVLEARIMFQIGKSLNGRASNLLGRMKINGAEERSFRSEARLACSMFKSWCSLTREAVDAWTIIAIRFRICKDMRRFIANLIWMTRSEGAYLLDKNGKFKKRNKRIKV